MRNRRSEANRENTPKAPVATDRHVLYSNSMQAPNKNSYPKPKKVLNILANSGNNPKSVPIKNTPLGINAVQ